MNVLLVSTYELGHQPLHLASPAAVLLRRGHAVDCIDLSVQPWDDGLLDGVDALAISVPMHTAMRLALQLVEMVRSDHPDLPICLYGLYAATNHDRTLGPLVDRVITGEYEPALLEWVETVEMSTVDGVGSAGERSAIGVPVQVVHLQRGRFELPARHLLPPLHRYARLSTGGVQRLVGYVEASHGCGFHCRHCPVPTVYDGRFRVVGVDTVVSDIDQLVAAGATHITFGDPDFLNGVQHSRRVVAEMHERHPQLTFDCTTKVELILRHRDLWGEMAEAGCLFVVSAFETVDDEVLAILDKGHTRTDMADAVSLLRRHGIEVRPSLLPFTPWTTIDSLVDLMDFVVDHDMVGNVDPVHYSIRLLVPEGSLLLDEPAMAPYLGPYRADRLGHDWTPAEPRTDGLQRQIATVVERAASSGQPSAVTFAEVRRLVWEAADLGPCGPDSCRSNIDPAVAAAADARPRLTEAWFCCAEPTELQSEPLRPGRAPAGSKPSTSMPARSTGSCPPRGRSRRPPH